MSGLSQVAMFAGLLQEFVASGKRLQPLRSCTGWRAVGGRADRISIVHVAAPLELFHAFALIHNDVMGDSDSRRSSQPVHPLLAARKHRNRAPEQFWRNVAVLLGDLVLGWSYDLVHSVQLTEEQAVAVWSLPGAMRVETMSGQYADLLTEGQSDADTETALVAADTKLPIHDRAPLQLGAALAGAGADVMAGCTALAVRKPTSSIGQLDRRPRR